MPELTRDQDILWNELQYDFFFKISAAPEETSLLSLSKLLDIIDTHPMNYKVQTKEMF